MNPCTIGLVRPSDGRGPTQEELPLSTRVHELARELGLKSQELLERIQKWGLEVKGSALASLDPSTADRIRQLMKAPGESPAPAAAARAPAHSGRGAVPPPPGGGARDPQPRPSGPRPAGPRTPPPSPFGDARH